MLPAIVHNAVPPDASLDDRDVLVQVEVVDRALRGLGYEPVTVECTLDLAALRERLVQLRPDVVFNLVESLGGSDWMMFVVPSLLDTLGIPYTGSLAEVMLLCTQKIVSKQRFAAAGVPTPAWIGPRGSRGGPGGAWESGGPSRWIIKALREHASIGLDEENVICTTDEAALGEQVARHSRRLGRDCFAEAYVEGREFNLSVLAGPNGPEVLPPAEIDFSAFPAGKPRVVGYRAKWEAGSFEFDHTPRQFEFAAADRTLLDQLETIARTCWNAFDLRGYARVDFRVDERGQPWVLEINPNPCLSPDAGFAAALGRASIPFQDAIARIIADARAPAAGGG
jgi:D-alanine-D-alanine ligase